MSNFYMTMFLWQMYLHVCIGQQMICLIGVNRLAPEMTLISGDMHDNKARTQSAAKMAPISRRQARMISGIAAFLIILFIILFIYLFIYFIFNILFMNTRGMSDKRRTKERFTSLGCISMYF